MFQSTHPQGVRQRQGNPKNPQRLFQSTHPQGVRRPELIYYVPIDGFQSTHPQGVRLYIELRRYGVGRVSIHAPAGGATVGLARWMMTR